MTRELTAAVTAEVQTSPIRPAALVKFDFDSGPVRLWSGIGHRSS